MELLSKDYPPDVISVTQHATKLIYNSNIDTTSVKNVVLIHNQVADYMTFVNGCNSNSFPIVYDFSSEKTELLQLLKEKFTSIQRVAFVFHGSESTRFLDQEYLFTEQDLINPDNFSDNLQFMINLANSFHIKNMDFLACNTLQHESWKSYYKILESSTGAVVGASNDLTGNLKYGGDWIMENTQEEVQSIYFTDEILNYQYLLNPIILNSVKYSYSDTTATATVIGFSLPPSLWNLIIPNSITVNNITYNVTSIGISAFRSCTSLAAVTIPVGVTSIGNQAFYQCTSLTAVTIPNGVTSIEYQTFVYCYSLTAVTIPSSVTRILDNAFQACTSLTQITIPVGVTSIGIGVFATCTSLTAVTIPVGVTSILDSLFNGCTSLTAVTIPVGVTSIGYMSFYGCTSLAAVTIPVGVTIIKGYAFASCSSLTSVTIPSSVTSINGDAAFATCSSLAEVNWTNPALLTSIKSNTFLNCSQITTVTYYNTANNTSLPIVLRTYTYGNSNPTIIFQVNKLIPTISNFEIPVKTYGNIPFTIVSPTSNSPGLFTYTSSNTSVATISGNTITILGAGSSIIEATQAATDVYYSNTIMTNFNVLSKTTLITAPISLTKTFGDSSFQLISSSNNNEAPFIYSSSDTTVATISNLGIVTIIGAGTANLITSQISSTNYTSSFTTSILTISKQTTLITIENPIFKTLGDPAFQLLCSSNNNESLFIYISSNTEVVTITDLGIISIIGTGTSILTISQNESANYTSNVSTFNLSIITSDKTNYSINMGLQNMTKQFSGYLEDSSLDKTTNSYDFSLPISNYSRDYLIDSENNSFRGYFAVNSLGIITNIYDLSQQISNYKWKDIFLNSNENIIYNSFSETFSNSIIIDTTSNIFFQSLSTQNNQAILFNNSFKTQYVSIDGIVENITEVGINIFVNIIIDTNSIMSTSQTIYLEELNVAITAMLGHFDDMVTPAPFTADAVASISVPVNILQDTFLYQTDAVDLDDIIANDIHYRFVYDPVNKPFGNPDVLVNTQVIQGAIDAGANLNSASDDFLRYIAFKLFGTPLGVDLIANEKEILDALSESFTINLDAKLISIASEGVLDRSVIINNPSKKVMDVLILTQPGRFADILQYAVDGEPSWFKVPLAVGDIVYMQVVMNPATDQHLLTNLPSAILARSYNLKLIASAAVVA